MKPWIALLITLSGAVFGGSLGYSYSQTRIGQIVAVHESRLTAVERRAEDIQRTSSQHMNAALQSWDRMMEIQKEFIATIRLQNDLLVRQQPVTKPTTP